MKNKIKLKDLSLNGKVIPWVSSAKHLGCKITNNIDGLQNDILEKRAQYINRANELDQEFYFAYSKTKIKVNTIYNTSFYGSQIWDQFGKEAERIEKTWNISQRIFLKLPRTCHKYFIEPLSETRHIKFSLCKRFMNFIQKIAGSAKRVLRLMLVNVKNDSQSTTGRNLRKIRLMLSKANSDHINSHDFDNMVYAKIPTNGEWKLTMAKEITNIRNGLLEIPGFTRKEISETLAAITT